MYFFSGTIALLCVDKGICPRVIPNTEKEHQKHSADLRGPSTSVLSQKYLTIRMPIHPGPLRCASSEGPTTLLGRAPCGPGAGDPNGSLTPEFGRLFLRQDTGTLRSRARNSHHRPSVCRHLLNRPAAIDLRALGALRVAPSRPTGLTLVGRAASLVQRREFAGFRGMSVHCSDPFTALFRPLHYEVKMIRHRS